MAGAVDFKRGATEDSEEDRRWEADCKGEGAQVGRFRGAAIIW